MKSQRKVREELQESSQNAFLNAFVVSGSVKISAEAAGVSRPTIQRWSREDVQGFKGKYLLAQEDFRESLQDIAMNRVRDQKPGDNPVLLITLLNAHWPEKYRRAGYQADGSAKEIMGEWKKWTSEWTKQNKKKSGSDTGSEADNAIEAAEKLIASKSRHSTDEPV
jgi:hypothetical protein